MKTYSINCPNCKGTITYNTDNLIAHCDYCGTDFIIESDHLTYLTSVKKKEEEKTKRILIEQNATVKKSKINRIIEIINSPMMILYVPFGVLLLSILFSNIFRYYSPENSARRSFPKIENNIIMAINDYDFSKATEELSKIVIPNNFSKNEKKTWNDKIIYYQNLILEKNREYDLKNPDNILAPLSSKKFQSKTGEEARIIFKNAGFTNIKLVEISGGGSIFNRKNAVDHILFGDKTEFTTDDYINKNDPIIIYYFEK